MSCCTLAIRNPRLRHKPQTNTAQQVFVTLRWPSATHPRNFSRTYPWSINIILSFTFKRISNPFLSISIAIQPCWFATEKGLLSSYYISKWIFKKAGLLPTPMLSNPNPTIIPSPQVSKWGRGISIPNTAASANWTCLTISRSLPSSWRTIPSRRRSTIARLRILQMPRLLQPRLARQGQDEEAPSPHFKGHQVLPQPLYQTTRGRVLQGRA